MSPEKQRIAIAEYCGWSGGSIIKIYPTNNVWWGRNSNSKDLDFVPDYLNDLNAMHEVEKRSFIGPREWCHYCDTLRWVMAQFVKRKCGPGSCCEIMYLEAAVGATAAERAEAFLKTIGKWEETKEAQP